MIPILSALRGIMERIVKPKLRPAVGGIFPDDPAAGFPRRDRLRRRSRPKARHAGSRRATVQGCRPLRSRALKYPGFLTASPRARVHVAAAPFLYLTL